MLCFAKGVHYKLLETLTLESSSASVAFGRKSFSMESAYFSLTAALITYKNQMLMTGTTGANHEVG